MEVPLKDRAEAGRHLAYGLRQYFGVKNLIVLALPRGGVPVAYEIAKALEAPLDLITVRKLGLPQHEEFAMGAIASGGIRVMNEDVVSARHLSERDIEGVAQWEQAELERRETAYRGARPRPDLKDRQVILVDDGVATGSTMQAAIEAVRAQGPEKIIVAVPVAPATSLEKLAALADGYVCLATPEPFIAVGQWYTTFDQSSDDEVRNLLTQAWKREDARKQP